MLAPSLLPGGRASGTLSDCLWMGMIILNTPATNTLLYVVFTRPTQKLRSG